MDLSNLGVLIVFLSTLGCCLGEGVLVDDKVKGVLGKNVTFKTTLTSPDSKTFYTVTWGFKSDDVVRPVYTRTTVGKVSDGYTDRVQFNDTTCALQLGPLTADDNGEYSLIIVTESSDQLVGAIALEVLEPVSDVKILASLTEAVEFNSTVVLNCSAKGSFLKYSWMNGTGALVADGERIQINEDGNVLTIKNVLRTDLNGHIYCSAKNDLEVEKSLPINITVHYGPDTVVMTPAPMVKDEKKGSNLTLSCVTMSSPPAELSWMLNGVDLKVTKPTLTLTDLQEAQSGNYTCVAFNSKTLRYMSPGVLTLNIVEAVSGANITGPTMPLIAGTSAANLTCSATAGKATMRTWQKDGAPVMPSERVTLSADKSTLSLLTVQKEDTGTYTCEMSNTVSKDSASYKIDVNYGPENTKIEGPTEVEVHDEVLMTCSAQSYPAATYIWSLNGTRKAVTAAVYTIKNPAFKDSGIYTCTVSNAVTGLQENRTHTLSVKEEGALDDGLSGGAIAGIVIAVLVAVAIIVGIIICKRRNDDIPSPY